MNFFSVLIVGPCFKKKHHSKNWESRITYNLRRSWSIWQPNYKGWKPWRATKSDVSLLNISKIWLLKSVKLKIAKSFMFYVLKFKS